MSDRLSGESMHYFSFKRLKMLTVSFVYHSYSSSSSQIRKLLYVYCYLKQISVRHACVRLLTMCAKILISLRK